ncbi:MAG: glycosyltransferase family 4 protein [Eubacterium sp.]|nr:glycosyltransferase family 4 protein [Eubacterium sp.]
MIGHKRIPSREGGVEIVVGELSSRMAALGNSVTAYNRKSRHIAGEAFDDKLKEWQGVKIKWIPTPDNAKFNAIIYSAFATMRAVFGRYDVIHFHAEGPCSMMLLAKLCGKKCVATIHGLDWQRSKWGGFATKFLKFGEKTAAKHADRVIVLSENVRQYFLDTYGRETVFIPNGISRPKTLEANIIKEKYGIGKDGYVLFLGRLVPEKGLHYLIEAYKNIDTDVKLVIAGGASHTSDYEREIKEQASSDERIIFTGFVQGNELDELYSNALIYCLPSDLEGMPISLLEAMSYGNACLTSDIPECTEVCCENAVYFKKSDVNDLAKTLAALLKDGEKLAALKSASADYICSKYNWQDVTLKTLGLYEELLK